MPPLFIHIGLHRTGTTFLQREVFPNLKSVQFLYATEDLSWLPRLVSEEDASHDPSAYEGYFYPAIQRKSSLISFEPLVGEPYHLYVNQTRNPDRLARLFQDASIIIGIRRQDTMLLSLYLLLIMQGASLSLADFLGYENGKFHERISINGRQINLPMFQFGHIADLYTARFPGRVHILVYEQMRQDLDAYVRTTCEIIGEKEVPSFRCVVENKSYGYYQYLLARLFNRFFSSTMNPDGLIPGVKLPIGVIRPSHGILLRHKSVSRWFSRWPRNNVMMPPQISHAVMEYFSPFNTEFEHQWNLGLDRWGYILKNDGPFGQ